MFQKAFIELPMEETLSQQHDEEQKILHVYLCHLLSMFYKNNWLVVCWGHPTQLEDKAPFALAIENVKPFQAKFFWRPINTLFKSNESNIQQ